jgi:uncharacterized protein
MPSSSSSFWPEWNEQPVFTTLLALLLLAGVVWASASAFKTLQESRHVGYGQQSAPSISVYADGDAVVLNDIATVDIGVTKDAPSATEVQTLATDAMNALTAAIKDLGIDAEDLQTSSYNVYPQYNYDDYPATIVGYEASQTLTVKIRNEDSVSAVLGKAAELGATNIGSLRFEADDNTAALSEARAEAIQKARAQAEATAQAMGATLGDIVSYSESEGGSDYPYYRLYAESMDGATLSAASPDVQMGQSEIELTVYITYGLR